MKKIGAALMADNNESVVVLFAHVFGTDIHSVKATLIDARRIVEDDIRDVLH